MSEPSGFSVPHVVGLIREAIPPMHPGGRPLVLGTAAVAGLIRLATGRGTLPGALATAAVAAFFRSPRRVRPPLDGVVLAAADGTVATVAEVLPPSELELPAVPMPRVSVFLSVLDVHVQRIPVDGRVVTVAYRPGAFLSADLDKASEDNERNAVLVETAGGVRIGVVQIAGLLARRRGRRGRDLRADPLRLPRRHLPAARLARARRGRAADHRRRDGAGRAG
jgi:phosphatidylserine decarboxylase